MSKKYLIAVDSGHGMETAGKRTPKLTKDLYIDGKLVKKKGETIKEKEFNKPTAEYLIKALERCGFNTINVSPGTSDISLQERVKKANNAGADFFISKHYNALDGTHFQSKAKGIVSIYNYGSTKGKKAATLIQEELIKVHGGYSYGARADKDISGFSLYVLKNTKMVSVLSESGFMDNVEEAERMLNPVFQKADAEATCKAICKYFEVKYVEEVKETVTEGKSKKVYRVICGSYSVRDNAEDTINKLKKQGYNSFIDIFKKDNKTFYRVVAGSYTIRENADKIVKELKLKGFNPFVTFILMD